jgi:hypothetical protein
MMSDGTSDSILDEDVEAELRRVADLLLQTDRRSPLIQFERRFGERVWLCDFPSLNWIAQALPESGAVGALARHGGLGLKPLPEPVPGAEPPSPPPREPIGGDRLERWVQCDAGPQELRKSLTKLRKTDKTFEQEAGLNVLRLVLGFLEWRDPESKLPSSSLWSPLLAIPVVVEGETLWRRDEPEDNGSLRRKLRDEFRINLPELDDGIDPDAYLDQVETWLKDVQSKIPSASVRRRAAIGALSFSALRLHRDLLHPSVSKHRHVRRLLAGSQQLFDDAKPMPFDRLVLDGGTDNDPLPALVFDADGSQHAVIADVLGKQKSLVVEGPPGTGKSQTIANLIAVALGEGKRVLFVSQKQAALAVVRKRLEAAGLGPFCLDLHGAGATTTGFLNRVRSRLELSKIPAPKRPPYMDRNHIWRSLARSANDLASAVGASEASGFEVIWRFEKARMALGQAAGSLGHLKLEAALVELPKASLDATFRGLESSWRELVEVAPGFPGDHVLSGIELTDNASPSFVIDELQAVESGAQALADLAWSLADWVTTPPAKDAFTVKQAQRLNDQLALIPNSISSVDASLCQKLISGEKDELFRDFRMVVDALGEQATWADQAVETIGSLRRKIEQNGFSKRQIAEQRAAFDALRAAIKALEDAAGVSISTVTAARGAVAKLQISSPLSPDAASWLRAAQNEELLKAPLLAVAVDDAFAATEGLRASLSVTALALPGPDAAKVASTLRAGKLLNFGAGKAVGAFPPPIAAQLQIYAAKPTISLGALIEALEGQAAHLAKVDRLRAHRLIEVILKAGVSWGKSLAEALRWCGEAASLPPQILRFIRNHDGDGVAAVQRIAADLATSIRMAKACGLVVDESVSINELTSPLLAREDLERQVSARLEPLGVSVDADQIELISALMRLEALAQARDRLITAGWCDVYAGLGDWEGWRAKCVVALGVAGQISDLPLDVQSRLRITLTADGGARRFSALSAAKRRLTNALDSYLDVKGQLDARLSDGGRSVAPPDMSLTAIAYRCGEVGRSPGLLAWLNYCAHRATLSNSGRDALVRALDSNLVTVDQLTPLNDFLSYRPLVDDVFKRAGLIGFSGAKAESWRESFVELDEQIRQDTAKAIASRLADKLPTKGTPGKTVRENTDHYLLKLLTNSKRPGMPIRKIMRQSKTALMDLFPCFMMSPLAVAQYLDPDVEPFDLVVMDEASQLPTHEGLGALARGRQFAVMGDRHQMPPSSLFKRIDRYEVDDDDPDGGAVEDAESILMAAQAKYPRRDLLWHYRSKHESLIQFSNDRVYDGKLLVFPNGEANDALGVRLIPVAAPRYINQQNLPEALTVVELTARAMRRELAKPESARRSIGVVAINSKQADLIEDRLTELSATEPAISAYLAWAESTRREEFFVKNLENVQGDERDIVILSLTYGPRPDGKIYQQFGPISQRGGYRRLNVLITRARAEMLVVSSLSPAQISDAPSKDVAEKSGRVMLRRFIQFAADGGAFGGINADERGPESPFEEAVGAVLDDAGIPYHWQVGSAGASIDIAIRHPNRRDAYVLAIECDGETWHRSASRREADRLRQQRLEEMGWRFHRIWSSDWFVDPRSARERLISACQMAIDGARGEVSAADGSELTVGLDQAVLSQVRRLKKIHVSEEGDEPPEEVVGADVPSDDLRAALEGRMILLHEDDDPQRSKQYLLVSGHSELELGRLGLNSNLGRQIEDCIEGELVTVSLPKGTVRYRLARVWDPTSPDPGDNFKPRSTMA